MRSHSFEGFLCILLHVHHYCVCVLELPHITLLWYQDTQTSPNTLHVASLVPRPHPVFQCCTLKKKTGRPGRSGDVIRLCFGRSLESPPTCVHLHNEHITPHVVMCVGGDSIPRPSNYITRSIRPSHFSALQH